MVPDPARPWKAIAAFVLAFLTALYASLQGRPELETLKAIDWIIIVLGAVVTAGATYMVRNPQVPADRV
jgi:hypothetical protein